MSGFTLRPLTLDDMDAYANLIAQTPEYFGKPVPLQLMLAFATEALSNGASSIELYGAFKGDVLCSTLGSRKVLDRPYWVENLVYLNKDITRQYNLHTTGFLELLAYVISIREREGRHTFLTAFVKDQLSSRLRAYKRALFKSDASITYQPSLWWNGGEFNEARYLLSVPANQPLPTDKLILAWTKPIKDLK